MNCASQAAAAIENESGNLHIRIKGIQSVHNRCRGPGHSVDIDDHNHRDAENPSNVCRAALACALGTIEQRTHSLDNRHVGILTPPRKSLTDSPFTHHPQIQID